MNDTEKYADTGHDEMGDDEPMAEAREELTGELSFGLPRVEFDYATNQHRMVESEQNAMYRLVQNGVY